MAIPIETVGRRHDFRGPTDPIHDRLRTAGARCDLEESRRLSLGGAAQSGDSSPTAGEEAS